MRAALHARHAVALAAAIAAFGIVAPAAAQTTGNDTTFYFTGQCTDCTGTANAQLVFANYDPTNPSTATFVSFSYASNLISYTVDSSNLFGLSGSLPFSATPTSSDFDIKSTLPGFSGGFDFNTTAAGAFQQSLWVQTTSSEFPTGNKLTVNNDYGTAGTWSLTPPAAVPEPDSAVLLLTGGVGIAAARRLRRSARR
ncbi:MAG: PEP-CTERM sorting domain-containing protein [Proteobacteria bacterium]|nr:PEP-CTERM sorting domain-containing protein [Pseudomonadota bacterium]